MAFMKTLISAAAACAAVFLFAGCTAEGQKSNIGKVRTFNAVFESSALRVDADDDAIVSQLPYASLANYKELNSGSRVFKAYSSGGTKLFETTFTLSEGAKQLFVVAGTLGNYSGFFVDDSSSEPGDNKIKVRMIHAAAGVPALDVYLTSTSEDISGINPTLSATAYKANSSFLELASGTYKLRLTTNGTKDVVYESDALTLNSKDIVSFAAYPTGSGKLVNVHQLKHSDTGDGVLLASKVARFKAANGVPGTTLNVLVDGVQRLSAIPFQGLSSYQSFASGTRQLRMEPTNTPGTALAATSLNVEPAREYTLLAIGSAGSANLIAIPDYTQTLNTAKIRVRVINAVNNGAPVNLLINFTASASNVAAASASRYAELDQGTYNISVSSVSSGATLFSVSAQQFDSDDVGKLYAVVLTGDGASVQGVLVADN
jgi:hypothetical protein